MAPSLTSGSVDKDLAGKIESPARVYGDFRLRSGAVSNEYFDKYRFESDPRLLTAIAEAIAELIPPGVDLLAGLELGVVPIATALSLRTSIPVVFVRKQAKTYGTCRLAEGAEIAGRRLLLVEDVVTSGGQVVASCHELRRQGALVEDVVCVNDRQARGREALEAVGLRLQPLFTKEQLDLASAANSRRTDCAG